MKPTAVLSSICPTCQSAATNRPLTAIVCSDATTGNTDQSIRTTAPSTVEMDVIEPVGETIDEAPSADHTRIAATENAGENRTQFGRFEVRSILGQGAFGTVYDAYDPLLDREVALKVPRFSHDDLAMVERFDREAKSAARLHHPNIVALFENGVTDQGPYLVSEFVDGVTLSQVIRKQQFDIRTAVGWVRQISEALYYAHGEGIVHRDIKPGNIMINRAGRPQVMDFGLAKRDIDESSNVTVEGQILGTPSYMSPEQARGKISAIGPHSDQYSVGVVLYELLCGTAPFVGPSLSVLARVGNWKDLPPTPRSIRPEIPSDLEACCLKAIEKDPRLRYSNMQGMANDLDHWLKGMPLLARPIGPVERLNRWCRKNRVIASLSGTIAAILLLLAIIGPWLAYRFKNLAEHAEQQASAATAAREKESEARELEKVARQLEHAARLHAERILIDNYTESGLTADRNGDPRTAILWFGNAVAAAANDPERERHNRIRMQSWLPQVAVPIHAFPQPSEWSNSLQYHPDGQALLSVSHSGTADWMNLATGKQNPLPLPHPITAAAFSPDGTKLVAASLRLVAIFEHPSGTELDRWESPDLVHCLQFSSNSSLLFLGGSTTVQIRDLTQPGRQSSYEIGSRVKAIEISPDSRRFAIRSDDKQFHVFPTSFDQTSPDPLLPAQPAVSEGELLPLFVTNDRLVTVDNEAGVVRCWNIDARTVAWQHPVKRVLAMTMSSNRQWLALGDNSEVLLLDATASEPFKIRIPHRNLIHGLGFNRQATLLLISSNEDSVQLYDVPSGRPASAPIPHNSAAHRCVWSPDSSTFATVNWGGHLIRVWKPQRSTPAEFVMPVTAHAPFVRCSSDGGRWLSSGFDGHRDRHTLEIVDSKSGQVVGASLVCDGLLSDADFVPRSTLVVLVGGGSREEIRRSFKEQNPNSAGFARVVDSHTGKVAFPDILTPSQPIAVRVSSDATTAVVLCHRGQVLLVDIATGNVRSSLTAFGGLEATHGYVIRDRIRISPDGETFCIWGTGNVAEVHDIKTGDLRFPLRHSRDFIHDVQFSPDGKVIATCCSDYTAQLWSAKTGISLSAPLQHPGWIFSAQFSRDGRRLLTACDDRHARIWDVATGTTVMATLEQPDQVFGVCLLPGDEYFLACDRSGQLTAWETRFGKMIAPARRMPGMVYQLSLAGSGTEIIASGRLRPCRSFRWKDWIVEPELRLSRDEMCQLGEIISGRRIHEGGAVTSLTPAEWMQRWQLFHTRHSLRKIADTDNVSP